MCLTIYGYSSASGDAGGALGAALSAHYQFLNKPRSLENGHDSMKGGYLGPAYGNDATAKKILEKLGAKFSTHSSNDMIDITARALADGNAVGWMQGHMEFGPRALGNRSILADPRSSDMQRDLNLKVKFRESFRPFAPASLLSMLTNGSSLKALVPTCLWLQTFCKQHRRDMTPEEMSLFGIDKLNVPRSSVPAITHVDYSARLQTVHAETNPVYHALLKAFMEITGVPMLVNTSFNVRGEPIVCTAKDAFRCFMGTNLDMLVVGDHILYKNDQDPALSQDYKHIFELD